MEIIEWCDEFRSSKRGGTRKASGHGLFSNELDVWTASRHMIRDATSAIGWLLTFFFLIIKTSFCCCLLLAMRRWKMSGLPRERLWPHCRICFFDKERDWWQKKCLIGPCFVGTKSSNYCGLTFYIFYANAVASFQCGRPFVLWRPRQKLRSGRTLTLSHSLVLNSHSLLKLTWAASTCTFISPPTATNRNRTRADKRPIGVIDCGTSLAVQLSDMQMPTG